MYPENFKPVLDLLLESVMKSLPVVKYVPTKGTLVNSETEVEYTEHVSISLGDKNYLEVKTFPKLGKINLTSYRTEDGDIKTTYYALKIYDDYVHLLRNSKEQSEIIFTLVKEKLIVSNFSLILTHITQDTIDKNRYSTIFN